MVFLLELPNLRHWTQGGPSGIPGTHCRPWGRVTLEDLPGEGEGSGPGHREGLGGSLG
jgi:hypothetical protein